MIDKVLAYIKDNEKNYANRLKDFLRIPSISTDKSRDADTRKAAHWVHQLFDGCGIKAEILETKGHPCVVADSGPANGAPTVLVYGHYDVQPVGDPKLWNADAFDPVEVDGALVARGSADDKGQVLTHLLAAEAWKKVAGKLPVRVKFLIEGEEEVGSPNLEPFIRQHRERLACDYVALSDTCKYNAEIPAITYGTKGLIYKQMTVTGPKNDLHSGSFGGSITNPGNALCKIITSLRDDQNRVTIPGFYDDVRSLSATERKMLEALPYSDAEYLKMVGSSSLNGEEGYSTLERRWVRPTLDVNGLFGGFMGDGSSTIIPRQVGCKVSMRIVPDQDYRKISEAFDKTVLAAAPPGVVVKVETYGRAAPYVCPLDVPGLKAAAIAVEAGFGRKPVMIREGGTLPILPLFKEVLGAESLMMGFCLPDCNAHGPNERFHLKDFFGGIRTAANFTHQLALAGKG